MKTLHLKKLTSALVLLSFVFSLTLSSCGGSYDASDSASADYYDWDNNYVMAEEAVMEEAYYDAPASTVTAAAGAESSSAQNDLDQRKIIKNASLSFETKQYDEFVSAINGMISSNGGYIESSETYGGGVYSSSSYQRSLYLTARIPAAQYDSFMNSASSMDIGAMTYKNETSDDVTMNYVDTESHITALETEYQALLDILEKAESLEDVITLQERISEINYELDSYKATLRKYDNLVSYCTVSIQIDEVYRETVNVVELTFGEKIVRGLKNNLEDIGNGLSDFAVWFVTSLPYIIIWAVIIALIAIALRAIIGAIKKKRSKKLGEKLLETKAKAEANGEKKE